MVSQGFHAQRSQLTASLFLGQSDESYIPYADRPEWRDVEPMPQKDAQDGLVPIAYSAECKCLAVKSIAIILSIMPVLLRFGRHELL
jgi:hypothetical protein